MNTYGAPQSLDQVRPSPLEVQPPEKWIIADKTGIDLRHPVTLQPLSEIPSFLRGLNEVGEFWAANAKNIILYGDVGPRSLKDSVSSLKEYPIDFYGDIVAPERRVLRKGTTTFSTISAGNGSRLAELSNELGLLHLRTEADELGHLLRGEHKEARMQAMTGMAIGMVSLFGAERWADAEHITDELRKLYRIHPEWAAKPKTAYLHLTARQALVGRALGSLGAPDFRVGTLNDGLFNKSSAMYATMRSVIKTSRLTSAQFVELQNSGHLLRV